MGALGRGMKLGIAGNLGESSAVDVNGRMSGDRGYDPNQPAKKKKQEDATGRVYGDVGYNPTPAPAPAAPKPARLLNEKDSAVSRGLKRPVVRRGRHMRNKSVSLMRENRRGYGVSGLVSMVGSVNVFSENNYGF